MKIYLTSQGSYSDYRITGAFSTEENAKLFNDLFGDSNAIEEFEVDCFIPHIKAGLRIWFVRMNKDGDTLECYEDMDTFGLGEGFGFDIHNNLYNHCWASGKQHAIKITNELRTRILALNAWEKRLLTMLDLEE